MVKTILLVKRKPGLSREEFIKHYEEVHSKLALKYLTAMRRYVRNYTIPSPDQSQEPQYDAISEFWWDSREDEQAAITWLQTKDARPLMEDEASFIDQSKMVFLPVDESVSKIQGKP